MSSTPFEPPGPDQQSAPIPVGYSPGDYVPFADRDPSNPSSIAGQWADPARQAQTGVGPPMTEEQRYRAIYGYDAPMRITLASWGHRVLGHLVDTFVALVASIPLIVGYVMLVGELDLRTDAAGNSTLGPNSDVSLPTIGMLVLGGVLSLVFNIYNNIIRQGRTGYSFGKAAVGIRLLKESTGQPMGAGLCFVRQLAHYVDSLVCYLGWLWPLWDAKKQTLADKIMGTVVVVQSPDSAR